MVQGTAHRVYSTVRHVTARSGTYQLVGIDDTKLHLGNPTQSHPRVPEILRVLRQRRGSGLVGGGHTTVLSDRIGSYRIVSFGLVTFGYVAVAGVSWLLS